MKYTGIAGKLGTQGVNPVMPKDARVPIDLPHSLCLPLQTPDGRILYFAVYQRPDLETRCKDLKGKSVEVEVDEKVLESITELVS